MTSPAEKLIQLKEIARELRIDCLKMLHQAGCGHTGGSLGMMDMMVALYFDAMNIRPQDPHWEDRDRFILATGHTCPALYVCLAKKGYFPKEELSRLRQVGSFLQGHPKLNIDKGIEMSTGSLGQGNSIANGIALGARMDGKKFRVYSMHSDGEIQEGMFWEAAMLAGHYKLGQRIGFLDWNNVQIDGFNDQIKNVAPIDEKLAAFGWHVQMIDGNDMSSILGAIKNAQDETEKPSMIVGKTLIGKGVSIFENQPKYHGVSPSDEELATALKELGAL